MTDLHDELHRLAPERVAAPAEVLANVYAIKGHRRARRARRLAAASVAGIVGVILAGVLVWPSGQQDGQVVNVGPGPAQVTPGWHGLNSGPAYDNGMVAATDRAVVVFEPEGEVPTIPTGYLYDTTTRQWDQLPTGPAFGYPRKAVWTGSELVLLGATLDDTLTNGQDGLGGAAWNPATNQWRTIAVHQRTTPQGIDGLAVGAAWTGEEIVVPGEPAAYDPDTDTWRAIETPRLTLQRGTTVWTGSEVLSVGEMARYDNLDPGELTGNAWDPQTGHWRELQLSTMRADGASLGWTGQAMLAVDGQLRGQIYEPETDEWRTLPEDLPLRPGQCDQNIVSTGVGAILQSCTGMVLVEPDGRGTPVPYPSSPPAGRTAPLLWIDGAGYSWGRESGRGPFFRAYGPDPSRVLIGTDVLVVPEGSTITKWERTSTGPGSSLPGFDITASLRIEAGVECDVASTSIFNDLFGSHRDTIEPVDGSGPRGVWALPERSNRPAVVLLDSPDDTDPADQVSVRCAHLSDALELARHLEP